MRAVIWIVVGILVVGAAAFIIYSRSQATPGAEKLTPAAIAKDADKFTKDAGGFDEDVKNLSAKLTSAGKLNDAHKALLAEMTAKASQIRDKAKVLAGQATDLKAAAATKDELVKLRKEIEKAKATLRKTTR